MSADHHAERAGLARVCGRVSPHGVEQLLHRCIDPRTAQGCIQIDQPVRELDKAP